MSLLTSSRHLLVSMVVLLLTLTNLALAMGDKKFLKGFILGLMFAQQKKDTYHHVSPMHIVPSYHGYR